MTLATKRSLFVRMLGVVLSIVLACYALYATIFFAWVATAPGSVASHVHAAHWANVWTTCFLGCVAIAIALVAWIVLDVVRQEVYRPQFSLAAMLLLMTLFAIYMAWAVYVPAPVDPDQTNPPMSLTPANPIEQVQDAPRP